jgi:hypothetical protein
MVPVNPSAVPNMPSAATEMAQEIQSGKCHN